MRRLTPALLLAVVCAGCSLWRDYQLWTGTDEQIQAAGRKAAESDVMLRKGGPAEVRRLLFGAEVREAA
jgi:hypothetical protein